MNEEEKKKKQIQTFITYINIQLEDRKISRITDIHTGVDLFFFMKSLCEKYSKEFPILSELEIEDLDKPEVCQKNIQSVLDWLEKTEKLQFSGITAEGVYNKDEEMTISLIWHIIIYFHFFSGGYKYPKDEVVPIDYSIYYEDMVEWANEILEEITGHTDNEIKELSDWKNGIALYSIIKTLYTSQSRTDEEAEEELSSLDTEDSDVLVHSCIEFASDRMGIPEVISIEEVLEPEELSLAIYAHYFRMFDELNELDAAASDNSSSSTSSSILLEENEAIVVLRRSLEEERLIRAEMNEEHERETGRLEDMVKEKDERIRSLTSTPNNSGFLDTSNLSNVSFQSTASTRSTMKQEMEKLKEGFMEKKGDILNDYKRQLRRVILSQYERGKTQNDEELRIMRIQLEEKDVEIGELRNQVVNGEEKIKKERKDAKIKLESIQGNRECCNIL